MNKVEIQKSISDLSVRETIDGMATVGGILETGFGMLMSAAYPELIPLTVLAAVITGSSFTMTFIRMRDQGPLYAQLKQIEPGQPQA